MCHGVLINEVFNSADGKRVLVIRVFQVLGDLRLISKLHVGKNKAVFNVEMELPPPVA